MILNPLNALKRKLQDDSTAFPKRLRLAKNVVQTHHFPVAPKERIIAEWILLNVAEKKLSNEAFRSVLGWVNSPDVTGELKNKFIEVTWTFLQNNSLEDADIPCLVAFLENDKISHQLQNHTQEFCSITTTLLKYIKEKELDYVNAINLFDGLVKYYKASKKKLEIVTQILLEVNLNTLLSFLDTECDACVQNLCDTVLFPMSKKSFFIQYFRTILQKENLNDLITEKGDHIQSVLKVVDVFFSFKAQSNDPELLKKYFTVFVTSFKSESSLVFAFYILATAALNMPQTYINPTMKLAAINFSEGDEKIKRTLFLHMLDTLHKNEIDVNVKLTDTISDSKTHVKKEFSQFLQAVMMGQLKVEGKPDKTTLLIVKVFLQLDPTIIENKLDKVLPNILVSKKNSQVMEVYTDMFNCLLEIVFKLSRGMNFIHHIVSILKDNLLAIDDEQKELLQQLQDPNGRDEQKIQAKILVGSDVIPDACLETYGRLTSELMYRQQPELLSLLESDLAEFCVKPLESGLVAPSTLTLTELLTSTLSRYLSRRRVRAGGVAGGLGVTGGPGVAGGPGVTGGPGVAGGAGEHLQGLEALFGRLGTAVLAADSNPRLSAAYLSACSSLAQFKLLHLKYCPGEVVVGRTEDTDVFDMSFLLDFLSSDQWAEIASRACGDQAKAQLNNLLLVKTIALELIAVQNDEPQSEINTKTYLIKELTKNTAMMHQQGYPQVLFSNLQENQLKILSKSLVKEAMSGEHLEILEGNAVQQNKPLLNALVLETLRNLSKNFENSTETPSLTKALGKSGFEFTDFVSEVKDMPRYFDGFAQIHDDGGVTRCLDILRILPIQDLGENHQISTVFSLLVVKHRSDSKRTRKSIDNLLHSIFELSTKKPDLFKAFPVEFMFDFDTGTFLELVSLRNRHSASFIVKCILETAVKKVKTNSEIVRILVKILLTNQKIRKEDTESLEYFSDRVFQISCAILPILAKEKRAITTSAYRSILAELQEKILKSLLKSFKRINFSNERQELLQKSGDADAVLVSGDLDTLNATEAYTLTLGKYCDSSDAEELRNLDCLWNGLEYFVRNAIRSLTAPSTKRHHIDSCAQLLTVTLRNYKKLDAHPMFTNANQLLTDCWRAVKSRLTVEMAQSGREGSSCEELCAVLKLVSELSTVECFAHHLLGDLYTMMILKKPTHKQDDIAAQITSHRVASLLWTACLKANITDKKCVALSKSMYRTTRNITAYIRQHYDTADVDPVVCELLKLDLNILAEVILAAKKIPLNHHFIDSTFSCLQAVLELASRAAAAPYHNTYHHPYHHPYHNLFHGAAAALNALLVSREELLEDRWPCFMQCYRAMLTSLCECNPSDAPTAPYAPTSVPAAPTSAPTAPDAPSAADRALADAAHVIEKLTETMTKRNPHIPRLAAYLCADMRLALSGAPGLARPEPGPARPARPAPGPARPALRRAAGLLRAAAERGPAAAFVRRTGLPVPGHKYVGDA